ncbi:hypothetical protein OGAPHI_003978 [Ogataea philodendri]|uniref:Eukaryotic translation initiation factor 3 subunit D n=1 Tax=Ogataea philodendri TaxID=1378263 RepID=A0A9P8P5W3_9ASCO|nr:uncharacterized protein OGAPHI_003978 [Ogataea philodendri]KAH3665790.1 hypothetical protein OGAPHI_003978 [Ogataea philodendri]
MTVPAFDFSKLSSPKDAWGPSSVIPESLQFSGVPYAPFSKGDRLGKAADWQQSKEDELKQQQLKNQNQKRKDQYHAYGASAAKLFGAEEEEEEFSVVDNSNAVPTNQQTVLRGRNRVQNQKPGGKPGNVVRGQTSRPQQGHQNPGNSNPNYRNFNNRYKKDEKVRDPSIKVNSKWQLVSEIEFSKLTKLNLKVGDGSDLKSFGQVNGYVKKFESFKPQILNVQDKTIVNPTTSEDPIIKQLAEDKQAAVFVTDSILSQLMCAARSSYSWDVKVTKKDGQIFFDKRDNTDRLEVDENSYNAPLDLPESDLNSAANLSLEATFINQNFIANSLDSSVQEFETPENPFVSSLQVSQPLLNRGYKYRKFSLPSANDDAREFEVIVRTEVDAYSREQNKYLSINALNQYAPSPSNDWKVRLSGSRGLIFAEELKKNNNKIARWATKSLLAGIDSMKIGFVSRANIKDNTKHVVAGALTFTPSGLSSQINLSLGNGWAIVRSLLDIIESEGGKDDYTFIVLKDPNAPKIGIYKIPQE